jgi:hypothetical protein
MKMATVEDGTRCSGSGAVVGPDSSKGTIPMRLGDRPIEGILQSEQSAGKPLSDDEWRIAESP